MASLTAKAPPKTDQLNADHLAARSIIFRIERVKLHDRTDQPVEVFGVDVETGERLLPWRPCKTMIRVLAGLYGDDDANLPGQTVELYRDPEAMYGGEKVGGIRIRAASGLTKPKAVVVTLNSKQRVPYRVEPLRLPEPKQPSDPLAGMRAHLRKNGVDDAAAVAYAQEVGVPLDTPDQRKAFALALTTEGSDHTRAFAEFTARAADGGAS